MIDLISDILLHQYAGISPDIKGQSVYIGSAKYQR